ncbi:hypothetical protein GF325_01210 [Candidatus Bathyarchaeota archaeon]|nr:hypothetical protein [Candidatus Bathyarchaeota archaeon]
MDVRRYQSKDESDKKAITAILKEELSRRKMEYDEATWLKYLKDKDRSLQNRNGMILAVEGEEVAGFVFTEIRYEISGKPYGFFHFPLVKKEYKTKVEELLCKEAMEYLESLKMKDIRTIIPKRHALGKSVIMKLYFKQHELSWRILVD